MSEKIWYQDLGGFLNNDNYFRVIPLQNMSLEEKMNAILRFFMYLGVLIALLRANYKYLFFGIIAALASVILYEFEMKNRQKTEQFLEKNNIDIIDNKVCARSSVQNPFMNPSIIDITENPDRPPACNLQNEQLADVVEKNFEKNLFRDVSDLYGKMSSQRQFYTMPATTIPNDQESFAKWCFGSGPTCKEGNGGQCYDNLMEDVQRRPGMNSGS